MKGFRKHIAASIAITAVFVVSALALSVSAIPVVTPTVQASQEMRDSSRADSFAQPVEASDAVAEALEAEQTVDTVQPAVGSTPSAPVAVVPVEEPVSEDANPQQAAPDKKQQELNPPTNLEGVFVTKLPPYVELKWNPNNSKKVIDYYLVYREDVEQPGQISVWKTKKSTYQDSEIVTGNTYRYWVTVVSKWGEESKPSNEIKVETQDTEPPAPPQGVVAAAIDPGVSIDWNANVDKNLVGYNVYVRKNNNKWTLLTGTPESDTHYYHESGTLNDVYAVSAVNVFGVESEYSVVKVEETKPVIYEESDPAVTVSGLWASEYYEGASAGRIKVAGSAGDRLNFTFVGRQVKLISANYWSCGSARIYIDGKLMATVNMYSADPIFQSVSVNVPGLKYGKHVLTLEVVGSGNPDGTYNFANADAFEVR
jgi:hypothetical protein